MTRLLRELYGYGAASIAALAVDVSILWILVQFAGLDYVLAATVSFISGVVVAYWLSIKLVFRQHRLSDRRFEFICFTAIGTGGLVINAIVISLAVRLLGVHYLLAKCTAAGFTFTFNFVARRQLLFVLRPTPESSAS
jgi:putative flippase GtrA